jgi:hypothetical protein
MNFQRNPQLSGGHAVGLPLYRAQRINRKMLETFFNMIEKVATGNNLSDTPGNIFNIDESGTQINNKPNSVMREKGLKMFMF